MDTRKQLMQELEGVMINSYRKMKQEFVKVLGDDITGNEFLILKSLKEDGRQKSSALSKRLNVSASHITAVTDSLTKKGLIMRERSSNDRRIVELAITEDGLQVVKTTQHKRSAYLKEKFSSLDNNEISQFIELFKKL